MMNEMNNQAFDILTLHFYDNFPLKSNYGWDFNIIIEEKANKDLKKLINERNQKKQPFSYEEKRKIFEDLMTCLYFLHMRKIAHLDIKPENILFYQQYNQYILRDFGACEKSEGVLDFLNDAKSSKIIGTCSYISPLLQEMFILNIENEIPENKRNHNSFKSDIYSLGLVFLEVFLAGTGKKRPKFKIHDLLAPEQRRERALQTKENQANFINDICKENIDFFQNNEHNKENQKNKNRYRYEIDNDCLNYYSPNKTLFQYMLHEDEAERLDILRLSLLYDLPLLMWPFSTQFNSCTLTTKSLFKSKEIHYLNGFTYFGSFYNEKRSGLSCKIKNNKNEDYFIGEFYDDFPNGEGTIIFNENYKYKGEISYGKLHGDGQIYCGNDVQEAFGNKWVKNKMKNHLKTQETKFKLGCLYKYDFLRGYQEKYTGKYLEIIISPDTAASIFAKLYNLIKQESLENVIKFQFFYRIIYLI